MGYGGTYVGRYSGRYAGAPTVPPFNVFAFDGGAGKSQRAIVIDAITTMLAPLHINQGGYLQAIEGSTSLAKGPDDDEGCADIVEQLNGRCPGVLVATGDMDFETAGDVDRWKSPLQVHLYFFSNHMRHRFDGRGTADIVSYADGRADPGVFTAMEHARNLICAQRAGGALSQIKDLRPVTERRIAADSEKEIWEQIYIVLVSHTINTKRNVTLELKQINTYTRSSEQLVTDDPLVSIESKVGKNE